MTTINTVLTSARPAPAHHCEVRVPLPPKRNPPPAADCALRDHRPLLFRPTAKFPPALR